VSDDASFAQLVSLASHDLRTPLATVHGFAKTLERSADLAPPADRYVEIIGEASTEMAELLDTLSVAARIESGKYDPARRSIDTLELARHAEERLGGVDVRGRGTTIETDVEAVDRAVTSLARCALRHGGLDEVVVVVDGAELSVAPITPASAPVVLGEDLRDLRAAVAVRLIRALGGDVRVDGETLHVRLA
jgi:two-component system, OmpR family, sensor kinase